MNKILLVYEDYADLMSVESALKKVGFDVIGLSSEYAVAEQLLSFNPDVVIGSGRGGKVSSLGVGKRLKEMPRWPGKSVLIFPANFKPSPQDLIKIRVDMILEAPVAPLRVLQVLAKLLGHDESLLLERLNKSMHVDSSPRAGSASVGGKAGTDEEAIYVKGSTGAAEKEGSFALESASDESQEGSQGFDLNIENKKESMRFKFGERMQSADREGFGSESSSGGAGEEPAFPDVDLKALERELLGGGAPEVERVEVAGNLPSDQATPEVESALLDLKKAQEKLAGKMKKYSALVSDVKVSPKSTVTRVEARRRQKGLAAEWDSENINELDKLRREFTKALFKKN
ncbi:ANTAR domain-containing protein [Bdellovibrio svalbardensis]|uniref:Response regulatory domain-containing protein n=1 Tax=Bdellovibrio svalbardensis TaxID=2972972 RepID=A0ABT6DH13_9BACT|nr:hypothetical protein [Bdellovibrio svalbardensis]MDG0816111.1 hypothetical protein [Bdellovibrio svalbardensis]